MKIYFRLLKYLNPYWYVIIGGVICMLLMSAASIAILPLIGKMSDAVGAKNVGTINFLALLTILIYFLKGIFTYGQFYLLGFAGQKIIIDIRVQVFEHIQELSLDFFSKWRTGDIMSRILGDITMMQTSMISSIITLLPNALTIVGIVGYLLYLNWKLTLISLIALPILSFLMNYFGQQIRLIAKAVQKKAADISSILQENISGIRVVKSFTMEKSEVERFKQECNKAFNLALQDEVIYATQTPLFSFIQALAVILLIWYGAYEVTAGTLSPSNLIAFFAGTALLADPISSIVKMNQFIQKSISSAQRVFEVIDIKPTVTEKPDAVKLDQMSGNVEFRNVSFKYAHDQGPVINNISTKVRSGEIIAIVGPSGAGKTTFVNLLPRFWDPTDGSIMIDGHDLRDLNIRSFRKHIGIVPQETILFSGTVKDNISYGKANATDEEIIRVAKMANAHDFIVALPDGYDTKVGERGHNISGGERQRIAVARALLRDPRILILDEATSSLDTASERLVQDALEKLMKGRTTFVIAHRLSTVRFADRIIVLNKGKIVEEGDHVELLKHEGLYKKLYDLQFKYDDESLKQA